MQTEREREREREGDGAVSSPATLPEVGSTISGPD